MCSFELCCCIRLSQGRLPTVIIQAQPFLRTFWIMTQFVFVWMAQNLRGVLSAAPYLFHHEFTCWGMGAYIAAVLLMVCDPPPLFIPFLERKRAENVLGKLFRPVGCVDSLFRVVFSDREESVALIGGTCWKAPYHPGGGRCSVSHWLRQMFWCRG